MATRLAETSPRYGRLLPGVGLGEPASSWRRPLGLSSASVEENVRPTGRSPKPEATPTVRLHERLVLYVVAVDL